MFGFKQIEFFDYTGSDSDFGILNFGSGIV
jgi:hypothetical protein